MAYLQAYDQEGGPMPLFDFFQGVIAESQLIVTVRLYALMFERGYLNQADLEALTAGIELSGYSIAVVTT